MAAADALIIAMLFHYVQHMHQSSNAYLHTSLQPIQFVRRSYALLGLHDYIPVETSHCHHIEHHPVGFQLKNCRSSYHELEWTLGVCVCVCEGACDG